MKILGRHLIVELADCDCSILNDSDLLKRYMEEAVRRSGATIVDSVFHRYNPQGVSGLVVIAESHVSIHTWPEYGYAAVDFFTCGTVDPTVACKYLQEALCAGQAQIRDLKRGIPSATDERLAHKPNVNVKTELVQEGVR